MEAYSDEYLLMELKAGNERAFTGIVNRYRNLLYLRAFQLLKDEQEAKDIVQDVFAWVWANKQKVSDDVAVKQYLFKAVKNKCIDKFRRNKPFQRFVQEYFHIKETSTDITALEHKELGIQLANAINAISAPACKRAFELQYLEGKSHKAIALEMGTNVQTVKNQVSKALKILRGKLKKV